LSATAFKTNACDICGCGVGGTYIGILPEFNKHIIGLRYRQNLLTSHLQEGGNESYLTTKERYQSAEVWSGWNITSRLRVMSIIPYNSISQKRKDGQSLLQQGIGDVSIFSYYNIINSRKTPGYAKLLVQSLWLGAGIKLPTGRYSPANTNNTNANLYQLGTGSYDVIFTAMYDIRLQDAGLNINAQYKMNTANNYAYQYGNKWSATAQLYYKFNFKNTFFIAPNAGTQYDYANLDEDDDYDVVLSGGTLLLATAGVETYWKKHLNIGGNYQYPLSQNLAKGTVSAHSRWMFHVGILF